MTVGEIAGSLDAWAPPGWAESYDNVGLLLGDPSIEVHSVLVALDVTEDIVEEAHQKGCQLIVAHHPLIFKGLKKLTGSHWVERTAMKALQLGVAVYASHTNLDNAAWGVNDRLGEILGLENRKILRPFIGRLEKLVTYVPQDQLEKVKNALFAAGAGHIGNYDECSFAIPGTGTFRPGNKSNPYSGKRGERSEEAEIRLEVLLRDTHSATILHALRQAHPYEEVAYERIPLANMDQERGAGMVGELPEPMPLNTFLRHLKTQLQLPVIRHTTWQDQPIKKVAYCGGSGIFLLPDALRQHADAFLTGDIKYHDFFEADGRLLLADIGHFESEQYTCDLIVKKLLSFATFAVRLTERSTNPILYA